MNEFEKQMDNIESLESKIKDSSTQRPRISSENAGSLICLVLNETLEDEIQFNIVIKGLQNEGEFDESGLMRYFLKEALNLSDIEVVSVRKVDRKGQLIVTLKSLEDKRKILKSAKSLADLETYQYLYVK